MSAKFFKTILVGWIFIFSLCGSSKHPIYVTVTEIDHNAKENILEVSCKIFTNDFEKTLRMKRNSKIDLLNPLMKKEMEKLVANYILQHLKISIDGKPAVLNFIGYEQAEECIESYFQVDGVTMLKQLNVEDDLLYEYKSEQISLLHVIVDGKRQSTKMNNPDKKALFKF
jgi:hypothetical protein